jgi:hypothetical protein
MSARPTLTELIEAGVSRERAEIFTGLPGQVTANPGGGYVDVQPQIRRPVDSDSKGVIFEDLPVVPHVRVAFFQVGGMAITVKVQPGSTGLLLILTWDLSEWLRLATAANPADLRQHHLANAIFIPGLSPDASTATYADDADMVLEPGANFIRLGGAATHFASDDSKVQTELGKIQATLLTGVADLMTGAVVFSSPYSVGSTACTKVKVE